MRTFASLIDLPSRDIFKPSDRQLHTYIIGQPGTGKSRLLESWIIQDILSGNGACVIDPHGDLYHNLLRRIACIPEVWWKVILIDPTSDKYSVNINPLRNSYGTTPERMAWFLSDIILKIWKLSPTNAPRMSWLMTNTFCAIADLGLTLLDIPRFLCNPAFRNDLLPALSNEATRNYFEFEFPKGQSAVYQWVTPLLNKLGELISDSAIRPMLANREGLDFGNLMDIGSILLVNLPKGTIGEGPSSLLGAFIVGQIQKAALARTNQVNRKSFYLYLDEFQNYTTDNIKDILSESRKYGLSLILAHQYLDQLTPDIRSAVLNTSGTLVSFRIGYNDGRTLSKYIFPNPGYLTKSKVDLEMKKIMSMPYVGMRDRDTKLGWEGLAQVLSGLPARQFWVRRRGSNQPIQCRSLDMHDIVQDRELDYRVRALIETSGQRYAARRCDPRDTPLPNAWRNASESSEVFPDKTDNSIWGS
jgi:hypothetical protein